MFASWSECLGTVQANVTYVITLSQFIYFEKKGFLPELFLFKMGPQSNHPGAQVKNRVAEQKSLQYTEWNLTRETTGSNVFTECQGYPLSSVTLGKQCSA